MAAVYGGSFAQKLPSNEQVIKDVTVYHGKLATAQLNGNWQLIKETGYNFANTAKHPVAAITKKEGQGLQTKIQGLAIYVRGSANDTWRFSRYFVYENSREVVGSQKPTNEELVGIVEKALTNKPDFVFSNCSWICWIYQIQIPDKVNYQQQSAAEMSFEAEIEFEEKLSGMTERYKQVVEFFCKKVNGSWEMNHSMRRQRSATISKREHLSYDALENLKGFCDTSFADCYGPQGPTLPSARKADGGGLNQKVKGLLKRN